MDKAANIADFEKGIGYSFKNKKLINDALTHTSYANENQTRSYERLEFLGDAIVDFIVGEYLFLNYPELSEGDMSRARAALVCEEALAQLAKKARIGEYMRLGHGAEHAGDRARPSILADMFEAHIAAIYLDSGFDTAKKYLIKCYGKSIDVTVKEGHYIDYKTLLQEKLQSHGACNIEYKIMEASGPVHRCNFKINVYADGKLLGSGNAFSKKEAQRLAAADALRKM